jgi:hypothetical protein
MTTDGEELTFPYNDEDLRVFEYVHEPARREYETAMLARICMRGARHWSQFLPALFVAYHK